MNWFANNHFAAYWWSANWMAAPQQEPNATAAVRSRPMAVYPGSMMSRM